jgi:hypothetical protein
MGDEAKIDWSSIHRRVRALLPATLCLNPTAHAGRREQKRERVARREMRREETPTVAAPADVEGVDADGVACRHERLVAGVVEHEGEHAVQHVDEVLAVLLVLETTTMAGIDNR